MEALIDRVIEFSGVSREQAINALKKSNNDITEALVSLINVPPTIGAPKQRVMTEEQIFFKKTREQLDILDKSIRNGFSSKDQSASSEPSDLQVLREEKAQQNNCFQVYHPSSPVLEVQKQEIVCPLLSEYSCGLQSSDQKQSCSVQECLQSFPSQEKEL